MRDNFEPFKVVSINPKKKTKEFDCYDLDTGERKEKTVYYKEIKLFVERPYRVNIVIQIYENKTFKISNNSGLYFNAELWREFNNLIEEHIK